MTEQVTVRSGAPLINTETPTVSGKVDNRELQQLPFTFRTQNTSPIPAIQAIPEVQRVGQQFSLSGTLPYQTEVSVDGILTTSVRRNGIGAEGINIFPSIESVEEIKVSSVNNTAEYSQVGDITTISKPGTNQLRGTGFYNFNDTGLNANPNYFNKSLVRNQSDNSNYGFSLGGPAVPGRTFFFGTFERLDITRRNPWPPRSHPWPSARVTFISLRRRSSIRRQASPLPATEFVRASQYRRGRASAGLHSATQRGDVDPPLCDSGNRVSNQFDVRIDQNFSAGHTVFGRLVEESRDAGADDLRESRPRTDERLNHTLVISDNYTFRPTLLNEVRFGMTSADQTFTTGQRGLDLISTLGLTLLSTNPPDVTGSPSVQIAGYTNFGESQEEPLTPGQLADYRHCHLADGTAHDKGGFDVKWFNWTSPVNFTGADDFGVFRFNNNIQAGGGPSVRQFPPRHPHRCRSDGVGTERGRRGDALRLLRSGRMARQHADDAQRRLAIRAAAAVRGPRRKHQ